MLRLNNRYISPYRILFLLVDTLILLGAAIAGYYLRFGWREYPIMLGYLSTRALYFTFVFQLSLYYFELYELKIIRDTQKFGTRFIQSIMTTVVILMISYYMLPNLNLYLGRGILFFTLSCAIAGLFFWRLLYRSLVKTSQLNERIIILGTEQFAREIAKEIQEKGDSGFEVIGHIEEQKERRDDKSGV